MLDIEQKLYSHVQMEDGSSANTQDVVTGSEGEGFIFEEVFVVLLILKTTNNTRHGIQYHEKQAMITTNS